MPFTPTFQNVFPVVGASADVWGGILNNRGGESYVDFQAIATVLNATETKADGALQRSGGTMTGELRLGDPNPTATDSAGFRGVPPIIFDTDKTIFAADSGKMLRFFGPSSRTLTIPSVGGSGIPVGSAFYLRNYATAILNIARDSGVTLRIAGSPTDKNCTLASWGSASLVHEDTNQWVLSGVGVG